MNARLFQYDHRLEDAVQERRDQPGVDVEQSAADHVESTHGRKNPDDLDEVKRTPVVGTKRSQNSRVDVKKQRRFPLDCADIGHATIHDGLRDDAVHNFIVDRTVQPEKWQARREGEEHERHTTNE